MNERDALLETIFDNPQDDAPRLIYSDWVEEHDEPGYANFIRLQIKESRGEPVDEEELQQAWLDYEREISPDKAWDHLVSKQSFDRGFPVPSMNVSVGSLRDYSRYWWPRLPVIGLISPLSSLNIAEFVRVPYLARIRSLVVDGHDPHGLVIPRLVQCHYLKNLRVLDLSMYNMGIEAAEALARAEIFERLEELRLPYTMRPNREAGRLLRKRFGDICLL
ncbi:TIGR02996 domain-containing protein [Zavarzinella formosa]|uniref:TIGR02996 domain-containing protein n=1 Tax=Zavarzinella formosa TaxID=360055 RepID=UPI0002FBF12A|nr:TIGR02996 domain-containing protein [Zavarzinella formosa]